MFASKNLFLSEILPTVTYVTLVDDLTNQTTFTFTNASIGAPGLIVVGYHTEITGTTARTFVSATIGGSAATSVVTRAQTGVNSTTTGLISRRITSGSTATVSITMSGASLRARIAIWRINNNVSDTAFTTATAGASSGTGLSATLSSVPVNAVGMAAQTNGTDNTPMTWTNATERYDSIIGVGSTTQAAGADFFTTASGNRTITTTHISSSQAISLTGAVWR